MKKEKNCKRDDQNNVYLNRTSKKNPEDRLTPKASKQKAYQIQEGGVGEGGGVGEVLLRILRLYGEPKSEYNLVEHLSTKACTASQTQIHLTATQANSSK